MTALASDWLQPGLPADGQVPVVVPDAGGQAPELLARHAPVGDPELPDAEAAGQHCLHRDQAQGDPAYNHNIERNVRNSMSGKTAKRKGSGFEREISKYLNEKLGIHSYRTPLSGAISNLRADLMGTPDLHVECKRTEKFQIYAALEQAEKARDKKTLVTVVNRRNKMTTGESLVVMRLDEWLSLYEAYLQHKGLK